MSLFNKISSLIGKGKGLSKEQVSSLTLLSKEERNKELGIILHDRCVKTAAGFVQEELQRPESPFRGLHKTDFFHEILVLNFWIFEKIFMEKKRAALDAMYSAYTSSFTWGWETSHKEVVESIQQKHRMYHSAWDDYTGHMDLFGEKVTEVLFGAKEGTPVMQSSLWIIMYTDRTMKEFREIKKSIDKLSKKKHPNPAIS